MTTSQLLLNLGLLVFVLVMNMGVRTVTARRFTLPLLFAGVAGYAYLRDVPTVGHDVALEIVATLAGVAFGVAAALLVRVQRAANGQLVMRAGAAYAGMWIAVIGGRIAFAYGASDVFPKAIGQFSVSHQITGAPAWTAAFVLMALAMVVTRVAVNAVQTTRVAHAPRYALAD